MRAVPVNFVPFLVWSQDHAPRWRQHAQAIGVSRQEADGFADAAQALEAAHQAEQLARQALIAATAGRRRSERQARQRAARIVARVRVHADEAGASAAISIYGLAGLDAVRPGRALPAPEMPWLIDARLDGATGFVHLRLGAHQPRNSRGTMYQVTRRWHDPATGAVREHTLALTSARTLVDTGLPAGPREVQYDLRAIRSGLTSAASTATVKLAA